MEMIQAQGVHHITLVGADRQTSIDFWEGVLGMPFIFEQPNLDDANESHILFRSRRRPAHHRVHARGPQAGASPHADRHRLCASYRVQRVARRLDAGRSAARGARRQAGCSRSDVHGFDLFRGSARAPDRARLLQIRAAFRLHARGRACSPRTICASRVATGRSPKSISLMRSKASLRPRPRACRQIARRRTHTGAEARAGRACAGDVFPCEVAVRYA